MPWTHCLITCRKLPEKLRLSRLCGQSLPLELECDNACGFKSTLYTLDKELHSSRWPSQLQPTEISTCTFRGLQQIKDILGHYLSACVLQRACRNKVHPWPDQQSNKKRLMSVPPAPDGSIFWPAGHTTSPAGNDQKCTSGWINLLHSILVQLISWAWGRLVSVVSSLLSAGSQRSSKCWNQLGRTRHLSLSNGKSICVG